LEASLGKLTNAFGVDVRSHVEALPLPSPSDLTVLFWNYLINLPMESEEGDLVVAPDAYAGRYDQYGSGRRVAYTQLQLQRWEFVRAIRERAQRRDKVCLLT
jgi:hypothetical protein